MPYPIFWCSGLTLRFLSGQASQQHRAQMDRPNHPWNANMPYSLGQEDKYATVDIGVVVELGVALAIRRLASLRRTCGDSEESSTPTGDAGEAFQEAPSSI
jgi:hypothetical protein